MMRMSNIKMTTTVEREKLLATLSKNLARHIVIVTESRIGYVKKAREVLKKRLDELESGKVVSLTFTLVPPADHSEVYCNCLKMVQWNQDALITLEADEFRQLVLDEWDWKRDFLMSNRAYSHEAMVDFDGLSPGRE